VTTAELLLLAARAGVTFRLDGDRLAYRAPAGQMTGELRDEVIAHKAELIDMLRRSRLDHTTPVPSPAGPAPAAGNGAGPLASGQERLWLIERRLGPSPLYNIHFQLLWRGPLDRRALEQSMSDIVARHAAMRTTFTESDGVPRAVVGAAAGVELAHADLRGQPPQARAEAAERLVDKHEREPFDLAAGPLLRASAFTLADDEHIVPVTQHHIITDGWSVRILLDELARGYLERVLGDHRQAGQARPGPALDFADYVRWEGQWRADPGYQERLAWWKEHLADLEPLVLHRSAVGRPEPPGPVPVAYRGAVREFRVPAALAAALRDLAAAHRCTLFTVLLTGWAILLYRHAGQRRFAIGTVTSGRERMEFHPLLGFFANTLLLRCDLSGNPSVATVISRVQAETEAVFGREIPFADIVRAAGSVPDTGLTPLIQAAFMFPKLPPLRFLDPDDEARLGVDVTIDARIDGSVTGTAKFDLSLTMEEKQNGIDGSIEYATALFGADTVQHLEEHFLVLLKSMTENPAESAGRLRLMSDDEQRRLLEEWSNPNWQGVQPRTSPVER
jgi:hypothetical protein